MKKWLLIVLLVLSLTAQEKPLIKAAGSPRVVKDQKTFLVKGYTLVPGGTKVANVERVPGVHILVGGGDEENQELIDQLGKFLNQPLTESLIFEIKNTIVQYYREKYGQYVAAIVPVQKVSNGVVILQILEGHIGSIEYKGQKWFRERVIANALGIQPGDPLIETEFLNDVTWANRNPFRNTQMVLVPSLKQGETNLQFITKDRFPLRVYVGADNTGFKSNDVYRLFAGFNWGDAFMIGDILSYQYTASPNFHDFQSHVANYTSFLPWQHIMTVFGTYGTVFPNIPNFRVDGKNIQGSLRYQIPFRPLFGLFRHHFEWGFDWKYLTSNLFFLGDIEQASVSTQTITITQFMTSYKFQRNWTQNLFTFRLDMYLSPWKDWIFPFQTSRAYNDSRAESHVRYAYWKGALSNVYRMKRGITLTQQVRGQLATGTLPVAEQFGLGGMNTVRGYYEQQFVADDAICINLEAFTPVVSFFNAVRNEFSVLVFVDYGFGYNYSVVGPEFRAQNLLGIGPGVRYDISSYFAGRLDYGFQILDLPQDRRFGRFHFSLIASY